MKNKLSFFILALFFVMACNLPIASSRPGNPNPSGDTTTPTVSVAEIVPVPSTEIQIDGAAYLAYQMPGDPFRFVCVQPCSVDQNLMFAQYAGFRNAHDIMVKLTGVDVLPEMVPVDIHVQGDQICGHMGDGPLGFTNYYPPKKPVICSYLFDYAQGLNDTPYTPEFAARVDQQTLFIHEYLHLIFIGRLPGAIEAMHDFVTPLAINISYTGQSEYEIDLCTYHPQSPPGDFGGYLFENLCTQNGFRPEDLASVMIELDHLYESGTGQIQQEGFANPSASPAQFRDILNKITGSDTRQAFMDACWPASLFGDSYTLSDACLYPTPTVAPTPVK